MNTIMENKSRMIRAGLAAALITSASALIAPAQAQTAPANQGPWYGGLDISRSLYDKIEWDRFGHVGDPNTTGRSESDQLGVGIGVRF
jgi:opacity protein-like surface antigen